MFFLDTATALGGVRSFWDELKAQIPTSVTMQVEPAGDIIEDTTGELVGAWSATPVTAVVGTSPAGYASPAGASVKWRCDEILDGRRLVGRTFVVPITAGNYQTDGTLVDAFVTILWTAAMNLQGAQDESFVVWHRPYAGRPEIVRPGKPTLPARAAHDGGHGLVKYALVADKVAILRSRRS